MKKVIIIILYTLFFAQNAFAQFTLIPDPVFENKLIQLGIDTDGTLNGQLTTTDALGVTRLNLNASAVTGTLQNLEGIEAFVDLITINCFGHDIVSLDFSSNILLDTIFCSDNNLTNIDVSNCPNLRQFECYGNNLELLDVSNCPLLGSMDCSDNFLSTLDLSAATNIRGLNCRNNRLTDLNVLGCTFMQGLSCNNNLLGYLDLTGNSLGFLVANDNLHYLRICLSDTTGISLNPNWTVDPSAEYTESCFARGVVGKVVVDDNLNCLVDLSEKGLAGQFVKFERLSDGLVTHFTTVDTLGNYNAYLDTGTYSVEVIPNSAYWAGCPSTQSVTITSGGAIQVVDWLLQPLVFCPILEVDLAAPFLRRTGGGSNYTVSYCNQGTEDATNAVVDVNIDHNLTVLGASVPIANQVGNVYTFNLGTIPIAACGSFVINVVVDSIAKINQTHCTEAHIYPDTICVPLWSGPIIDGDVQCQDDTVFFTIRNVGAAMGGASSYTIIQDDIILRGGPINLGAGQTTIISQEAFPGATYRINVPQDPGFPPFLGNDMFSKAIEGCVPLVNGSFNTGFINQFSNGYSTPFKAIDCQQNIAAYDPNDKSAQPEGYLMPNYLGLDVPLDYKIRFQNTGTDTAFNIVILDTLSPYLDVSSLQMGASSHVYRWNIIDGNVLEVIFPNIMLVDSNANEPLSHGFFRYRIDQLPNNPLDSVIENQAAIYFDYNPPIFTNTTFHTLGIPDSFIVLSNSGVLYQKDIDIEVFPNPFKEQTTFRVFGKNYSELNLLIFDVSGRLIRRQHSLLNNEVHFYRKNLPSGVYFYRLQNGEEWLNSGKIVVQ